MFSIKISTLKLKQKGGNKLEIVLFTNHSHRIEKQG